VEPTQGALKLPDIAGNTDCLDIFVPSIYGTQGVSNVDYVVFVSARPYIDPDVVGN
jgi:hypothetical protein